MTLISNRTSSIRLGALAITIAASIICADTLADPSRIKVTGKVDPATGYRIDYTVSSRFQQDDMMKRIKGGEKQYVEFMRFLPASSSDSTADPKSSSPDPSAKSKSHEPPKESFSEATLASGFDKGTVIDKQGIYRCLINLATNSSAIHCINSGSQSADSLQRGAPTRIRVKRGKTRQRDTSCCS